MSPGTKTVLFGVHQFAVHPWFVALGWWKLYGFPWDPRLWLAFFVHDLGYLGKPNLDGAEGELHPYFGAQIMQCICDDWFGEFGHSVTGYHGLAVAPWFSFTLYHSRFLAKKHLHRYSKLCVADKLAIALVPRWLYLMQANLTGEIHEYMRGDGARTPAKERGQWQWLTDVQTYCRSWAIEHRDLKPDNWTGSMRDLAETIGRGAEDAESNAPSKTRVPPDHQYAIVAVVDPGHCYDLPSLDGDFRQKLQFVKRSDAQQPSKYPGNQGSYPGSTLQFVIRALLERTRYLQRQVWCPENAIVITAFRCSLWLLEFRAARRHRRFYFHGVRFSETAPMCGVCGHTVCEHGNG